MKAEAIGMAIIIASNLIIWCSVLIAFAKVIH